MLSLRVWVLIAGLLATNVSAGDPDVKKSELKNLPSVFFYFDDSSVMLALDTHVNNVLRSDDDAKNWREVKGVPSGKSWDIIGHPFDNKRAFILGEDKDHWYTKDRGATWSKFTAKLPLSYTQPSLVFHAKNPDWILYSGRKCADDDYFGLTCKEVTYYTKDGFQSDMTLLREDAHGCIFAHGTLIFKGPKEETILCVVKGVDEYSEHRKLRISDDWFKTPAKEPKLDGFKAIDGLVGIAGIQKFIVAAVKARGTDEMALYVTDDTATWDRAEFPHDHGGLKEDAYTILESTPYSIQVDVLTTKAMNPMGSLFTSNSNGTYFTRNLDHTNRVMEGLVDFEQLSGIQGIVLTNVVGNPNEVSGDYKTKKKIRSVISFDDGRFGTWMPLKGPGGKDLHLHSVTSLADGGRIFSSRAPGIVMGVGSLGDHLAEYTDCDLFISDDGGLTWDRRLTDAHKYEFGGSGSILVAINDEDVTDEVMYSINHGKEFKTLKLGEKIRARLLTTTPDSTTLKFTLIGTTPERDRKTLVYALDFANVFDRKCKLDKDNKDGDFERWSARKNEKGEDDCLMGHKQYYWRRKADAKCYVGNDYVDPEPEQEVCECEDHDFECDFNFVLKDDKCVPAEGYKFPLPDGECKKREDKYKGPSGYRKIPGNDCKGGIQKDAEIERNCDEVDTTPPTGNINNVKTAFKGKKVAEYFYLENSESSSRRDETIIMRTEEQEIWITRDHGANWDRISKLKDVNVVSIYPNVHFWNVVYFITPEAEVWYTTDRGAHVKKMKTVPTKPNRQNLQVLDFHPKKKDWLIWTGQADCDADSPDICHSVSYYTRDNGETWNRLRSYVGACKWIRSEKQEQSKLDKLIFCEHFENEVGNGGGNVQLIASDNFFETEDVKFGDIIGFATMAEFIIVASINEDGTSLKASASIDGNTFAEALFPSNFNVPHQTAYTVLDSETHAVFLHVTVNPKRSFEYGSLLKSNSNGTNYVLSLDAVNRNEAGYVDFEKLKTLEGVAIANRVINADRALDGEKKKLKTMITFNDGAKWDYIAPPKKDSEGKDYECASDDKNKCSLNLHHYTERVDPRDTFGSGSAVGLMLGVGNVGDILTGYKDGNTFLTRDGGATWKEVKKGQYQWEYGDQGSVIVLVENRALTDKVYYSLDEGASWHEYKFADSDEEKMRVSDISTLPTDTSRKFLLWGEREGGGDKFWTVQLDFTGLTTIKCVLKEDDPDNSDDFELWKPHEHGCLFGHQVQYYRKIPEHMCYIGRKILEPQDNDLMQPCKCEDRDFECDFNYQRKEDHTCQLVPGYKPPDHKAICTKDKNAYEYWEPTGYRRIPSTLCEGGKELDKVISRHCPNKEKEYNRKHGGARGFALFLLIVAPIAAAFGIGWFVWTHLLDGRFGAIRLGEDSSGQSPFVKYPIIVIAAIVAVAVSIPTILGAIGSWVSSKFTRTKRYTSRSSFARGADYSVVNTDEGELLGSDDEDEF